MAGVNINDKNKKNGEQVFWPFSEKVNGFLGQNFRSGPLKPAHTICIAIHLQYHYHKYFQCPLKNHNLFCILSIAFFGKSTKNILN